MHHQIINVINNVWKLKMNVGDKNEKFVSSLQKVNFNEIYFCRKLRTVNFTAVVHIWKKCILNNPVRIKPGVFWWICKISDHNPADIYSFKVNNRNTRKRCEICSKLIIKTSEWRHWCHWRPSGVFIVNFEHISHLFLVFQLLALNK